MMPPRRDHRWVYHYRSPGEQAVHCCLQVRHSEGKPNLPADALPGFYLIDGAGVCLVEDLQRSYTHIKDDCLTVALVTRPKLLRLYTQTVAIEPDEAFIIACGEGNTQFHNWPVVIVIGR